jgi:hypothetical protein
MKKEKVYCRKCRFYVEDNMCAFEKNIRYKHTPIRRITIYGNALKLNKRNKCKNYQVSSDTENINDTENIIVYE